jgi:hypothetical protein
MRANAGHGKKRFNEESQNDKISQLRVKFPSNFSLI